MANERDRIIWQNVERLLSARQWNLVELAKRMGIKPQALNSLKSGVRGIGSRSVVRLAKAFDVEEIEFYKMSAEERKPVPIPVISWIKAGTFAEPSDNWPVGVSGEADPVFSYRKVGPHSFGLRVEGDSMAPRYLPGDTIIVDPELRGDNGSPCVVLLNGEVSFKLFHENETEIRLQPINDRYPETIVRKDSRADFKVIGKVVDLIAKI